LFTELLRIAGIQLRRIVELCVAPPGGIRTHAAQALYPRRAALQYAGEMRRVRTIDHVVEGASPSLFIDRLDCFRQFMTGWKASVCLA